MRRGHELIEAMLSHELTDSEGAALNRWVKTHPEGVADFVRETFLARCTRDWFHGQQELARESIHQTEQKVFAVRPFQAATTSTAPVSRSLQIQSELWPGMFRLVLRIAACLVVGSAALLLAATWWARPLSEPRVLGHLVASVAAQWEPGREPGAEGLLKGDRYSLARGLALVEMSHGIKVVIEGPAEFKAVDEKEVQLVNGKLVAICRSKQSHGFKVKFAGGDVRDLGTEFGVHVKARKFAEVQVFEGEVEIAVEPDEGDANRQIVRAGQGRRLDFSSGRFARVPWRRDQYRQLADFHMAANCSKKGTPRLWLKLYDQLSEDPELLLWCDMQPLDGTAEFVNLALLASPNVELVPPSRPIKQSLGRVAGNASLDMRGIADPLQVELPGTFEALTFAAWVRLQPESRGEFRHRSLLMSEWNHAGHVHWQFKGDGFRLTYPLESSDQHAIYSASTQKPFDGNWHLVATTIDARDSMVVTHYVDGEVVAVQPINEPPRLLQLGWCTVGSWRKNSEDLRTLNGQIDDLFVWRRALSSASIKWLFMHSRSSDETSEHTHLEE